jgi:hypothetical protein
MESPLEEFVHTLHKEKLNTMKERSKHARDKILFILGIMGFGSLSFRIAEFNSSTILFLVPLVAFGYDLYINASDEGIKRIGAFLREIPNCSAECEQIYEMYVKKRRGSYAPLANVLFSMIGTFGALLVIFLSQGSITIYQAGWFVAWGIFITIVYLNHRRIVQSFDTDKLDDILREYKQKRQTEKPAK